jgi:hypothetical protein
LALVVLLSRLNLHSLLSLHSLKGLLLLLSHLAFKLSDALDFWL